MPLSDLEELLCAGVCRAPDEGEEATEETDMPSGTEQKKSQF